MLLVQSQVTTRAHIKRPSIYQLGKNAINNQLVPICNSCVMLYQTFFGVCEHMNKIKNKSVHLQNEYKNKPVRP